MSSKLIPPKVGSKAAIISIPANFLNRTALPSITGLLAKAPILPRPRTAEPFVMTPTKLPLAVYLTAVAGSFTISKQAEATPGVYAKAKSR